MAELTKVMREQINEAKLEYNYVFDIACDGSVFNKRHELAEKRFMRVFSDIIHGLAYVEELGFVDTYEKRELINEIQKIENDAISSHRKKAEEKLGTREYTIQYLMYEGWAETHEDAERQYEEEWT